MVAPERCLALLCPIRDNEPAREGVSLSLQKSEVDFLGAHFMRWDPGNVTTERTCKNTGDFSVTSGSATTECSAVASPEQ